MSEAKPYSMFTNEERWNLFCKNVIASAIYEKIKRLLGGSWMDVLDQESEWKEWIDDLKHFSEQKAHERLDYSWENLFNFWDWLENDLPEYQSDHVAKYGC